MLCKAGTPCEPIEVEGRWYEVTSSTLFSCTFSLVNIMLQAEIIKYDATTKEHTFRYTGSSGGEEETRNLLQLSEDFEGWELSPYEHCRGWFDGRL